MERDETGWDGKGLRGWYERWLVWRLSGVEMMVRCGVTRCVAVRCGVVWCGEVVCGVVWSGVVW